MTPDPEWRQVKESTLASGFCPWLRGHPQLTHIFESLLLVSLESGISELLSRLPHQFAM